MTTYWAPFLHIYQPPWQDVDVLRKIDRECYKPLFLMIERHPTAKITLNIQGCLIEMLENVGLEDTIEILQNLVEENKIEIVGTGKFHPILPLIPKRELKRQIHLNEQVHAKTFGKNWKRRGFFPPEMAVSQEILPIIQAIGYKWIIMSGIAHQGEWPHDYIQRNRSGLLTFFRDDIISNEIAFNKITAADFVNKIAYLYGTDQNHYVITAMDGETFGHHIPFYETTFLAKALSLAEDNPYTDVCFISDLIDKFPIKEVPMINASTWSTDGHDLASNVPYPLWKHPFNPVHKLQFRMLKNLYKLLQLLEEIYEFDRDYDNRKKEKMEKDTSLNKKEEENPITSALSESLGKEEPEEKLEEEIDEKIEEKIDKDLLVLFERSIKDKVEPSFSMYYQTARYFYDRALHSCWLWWASMRPHWSPNLIYKGVDLVMKTALNAQLALINHKIGIGEEFYANIMDNTERLMTELIEREAAGQHVRTF